MHLDESRSEGQVDLVASLIDEACEILGQRQYISAKEAKSWDILDGKGIGTRGTAKYPTSVIVELGFAIKDLIKGNLLLPPEGFGCTTGHQLVATSGLQRICFHLENISGKSFIKVA